MSRSAKQADLRRRMAEARSKLATTQASAGEADQDTPAVEIEIAVAAGRKRPLPPSSAGGGILRKSKYSSTPAAAAPSAVVAEGAPKNNDGALGSLMAGYDDSSSDEDDGGDGKLPPSKSNHVPQKPSDRPAPAARFADSGSVEKDGKGKRATKFGEKIDANGPMVHPPGSAVETEATTSAPEPVAPAENAQPNGHKGSISSAAVSDEAWDEFNALLDDDESKAAEEATPAASEETEAPAQREETKKKSKKRKKKKKKQQDSAADPYDDNAALDNVEQASYEARVGRLMLLRQKGQTKKGGAASEALPAMDEFYDPGLAFRKEDEAPAGEPAGVEDATNPGEEKDGEGAANVPGAAPDAPPVSLAKILRDKRDQARGLSSRGKDDDDDGADDAADGCWF
ncbi:hypothetical protein ACHAXT_005264 [Thalassiosira profunda]